MNDDFIYTVTSGHIEHSNWRCWAWFSTFEEAERAVINCGEFFWEHYYDNLVIEQVPRGAISPEYREWWYKWDGEWLLSNKPEALEGLSHFGVG